MEQWAGWQQCHAQAMESIRHALQGNPRSPYLWANLLLTKYHLSQFDGEFYEALQRSRKLGSHELGVNRVVAYVGLREWSRWASTEQELFRGALFAIHAAAPGEAKRVADEAAQGQLYCLWTQGDPRQHYSCRQKKKNRFDRSK